VSTTTQTGAHALARADERLFHDLFSPPEIQDLRRHVRRIVATHLEPLAPAIGQRDEVRDGFPQEAFTLMAEHDLYRLPFAAPYGAGLEHRATATAVCVEELAYASNSLAAVFDVHCILAGHAVSLGPQALVDEWMPRLCDGSIVGSFATSEPLASTDLSPTAVQTVATREADHYVVHGVKRWISNSPVSDFVVTLCRTGDAELSLLLVPLKDTPGVSVGRADRKLGNRGQLTADVHFDGARVPATNMIGEPGQGLNYALRVLTYGRIGIGAAGVGMAQRAFDLMVDQLQGRNAFGRPLGAFQHWQFQIAEYAADLEAARSLYLKAALRMDSGVPFPEPEAAMAKLRGSALAVDIARDAIQVLGGYGFTHELGADGRTFKAEEIYRDAKIGEIYEGANEIQKWVIARAALGRDVTG
jgi:alkylation response protein AidB-like acyl-CoA dehydrogenase